MRIRLRLFGITVASVTYETAPPSGLEYVEQAEEEIGGGSGHNFERAPELWDQPDDGRGAFGFRGPKE